MTKPMEGPILVSGSIAFDHIMTFPGYFKDHILPDKVHMINVSFLVDKVQKQYGGCAPNIAYTLALLGHKPRLVGAAGNDFDGYADYLAELGIDIKPVVRSEEEITATCFITTDQSDNQITGFYVGAMPLAANISIKELAAEQKPALLIVAPDDPGAMLRHCREAKEAGVPLVFDPSFQVSAMDGEQLMEGARGAKALILNDYEFAVFQEKTGKSVAELHEDIELLVVTLGEHGSKIMPRGGDEIRIPAAKTQAPVDPTGCGDAFRGGFIAGLVQGLSLEDCGRMGSVTSVYAVEQYGTQKHAYSLEEFKTRYQENFAKALA